MGTPDIAVHTLSTLYDSGIEILLVVTRADKPKGRGKNISMSPVKEYALNKQIDIYQPDKLRYNDEAVEYFKKLSPDYLVVVAYGRILPRTILDIPKKSSINLHFSLLPKYRGAAPVNWAVFDGEKNTGVTTMLMDDGLDTGDILLQSSISIGDKNSLDLGRELAVIGADLLLSTLEDFDNIVPTKQIETEHSLAPIIKKDDGLINWQDNASKIERQVRAFYGWPSAYTYLNGKILKINYSVVTDRFSSNMIGRVVDMDKDSFTIGTSDYCLKILNLQLEGKKPMDTSSFLAGYSLTIGDRFG